MLQVGINDDKNPAAGKYHNLNNILISIMTLHEFSIPYDIIQNIIVLLYITLEVEKKFFLSDEQLRKLEAIVFDVDSESMQSEYSVIFNQYFNSTEYFQYHNLEKLERDNDSFYDLLQLFHFRVNKQLANSCFAYFFIDEMRVLLYRIINILPQDKKTRKELIAHLMLQCLNTVFSLKVSFGPPSLNAFPCRRLGKEIVHLAIIDNYETLNDKTAFKKEADRMLLLKFIFLAADMLYIPELPITLKTLITAELGPWIEAYNELRKTYIALLLVYETIKINNPQDKKELHEWLLETYEKIRPPLEIYDCDFSGYTSEIYPLKSLLYTYHFINNTSEQIQEKTKVIKSLIFKIQGIGKKHQFFDQQKLEFRYLPLHLMVWYDFCFKIKLSAQGLQFIFELENKLDITDVYETIQSWLDFLSSFCRKDSISSFPSKKKGSSEIRVDLAAVWIEAFDYGSSEEIESSSPDTSEESEEIGSAVIIEITDHNAIKNIIEYFKMNANALYEAEGLNLDDHLKKLNLKSCLTSLQF